MAQTAKERRYDRQLRLWGATGQAALEEAHILLINSGSGVTGIEALKNLILPGIGQFTIQDSALVTEADLGVNFFLGEHSRGKPRAQEACKHLLELNPDVQGHAISESLGTWILSADVLAPYTLIMISSPIRPEPLSNIMSQAAKLAIPVIYHNSVGYYSRFSIVLPPAYPIVDTHPESAAATDLRLLKPWPALIDFAREKTKDLQKIPDIDIGYVPFIALLLHFLDEWRSAHNGAAPVSYQDKMAFRDHVKAAAPPEEENYEQAIAAILKNINPPTPPTSVLSILDAPEAHTLSSTSTPFWILSAAVHAFYQRHEQLPLPGSVPDMKTRSADFIAIQDIYKAKAREDCAEVTDTVRQLETKVGRSEPIPSTEIEQFCKLAAHIKLIRTSTSPLAHVLDAFDWNLEASKNLVSKLPTSEFGLSDPSLLYIAFVAYDRFLATQTDGSSTEWRVPGITAAEVDADAQALTEIAVNVLDAAINGSGTTVESSQHDALKETLGKICQELTRAAGSELHNIASLTGGMIGQEILKVVTGQYVPADNTVVFDGIVSKTVAMKI
ncbi:hypothetical protein KVT40_003651 [Elsinoe batatas]|uniref:NEDD8-activating enzyme E1 regulatory subunit n=1 Tax=Elsinoe batatas TaxID=2601811 RepID=A0A8K0PHT4_9PEZI|nr:hypothetical protein KVT40_003651 [Elsinoe batatas]